MSRGTREDAVAAWLRAQHLRTLRSYDSLCRSGMGIGVVGTAASRRRACTSLFSYRTGAILGLSNAPALPADIGYSAEDAFVVDDRTVLIYGRRAQLAGADLDPRSAVVYVMRLVPGADWRWVGTTDARTSVGWVPPGFPPVRQGG